MSTRTTPWPSGTPSWADVPIPDHAVADPFYEAVLGWRFEAANPELGGYANAYLDDRHVAGSMALMPNQPVAWTLYFSVADAQRTADVITEAGGIVHAGPMDVMGLGTMVIATDPTGAMFGLWQPWDAPRHEGLRRARCDRLGGPALDRSCCGADVLRLRLRLRGHPARHGRS